MQKSIPMIGTNGTSGVLKPRRALGSFTRRTSTPAQTSTKAKSVPMFVSSAASLMFAIAAKNATNTPVRMVVT